MSERQKDRFRRRCKRRLLRRRGDARVARRILELVERLDLRGILAYLPMRHEPDLRSIFPALRRRELYVPLMEGQSLKMVKLRLPLRKRRFGIYEPKNSDYRRPVELAIVPVVGVDGDFRRIGFGKGMYDRFFEGLGYRPLIVFVQSAPCITGRHLADAHDIQGDLLITPQKIYIRGMSDVGRDIGRKFCRHRKWRCRISPRKKSGKRETRRL